MAKNRVYEQARKIPLPVADGVLSGEVVISGTFAGVALSDKGGGGNLATETTVDLEGAYAMAVTGPVTVGQPIIATLTSGRVTALNGAAIADAVVSPNYVGKALKPVANGATATIAVKLKKC